MARKEDKPRRLSSYVAACAWMPPGHGRIRTPRPVHGASGRWGCAEQPWVGFAHLVLRPRCAYMSACCVYPRWEPR